MPKGVYLHRRRPLQERFLEKIHKTKNCWIWKANKDIAGYGRIWNEAGIHSKDVLAHRIAHELFVGPIPNDMCVLHKCDNKFCVNPNHLFLGTKTDNNQDRNAKGRQARGECHGKSKLNSRQVQEIRRLYQWGSSKLGSVALGRRYGISSTQIRGIVHGQYWKE